MEESTKPTLMMCLLLKVSLSSKFAVLRGVLNIFSKLATFFNFFLVKLKAVRNYIQDGLDAPAYLFKCNSLAGFWNISNFHFCVLKLCKRRH